MESCTLANARTDMGLVAIRATTACADHSNPDIGQRADNLYDNLAGWLCLDSVCFELELDALDTSISRSALGARVFLLFE